MCGGGGAQQLQCKSESAQCSEKQQSPAEGEGGGLKFETINAGKTITSTPKKRMGKGSYLLYFVLFHSPQPNNKGPAWPMGEGGTLIFIHT